MAVRIAWLNNVRNSQCIALWKNRCKELKVFLVELFEIGGYLVAEL